MAEQSSYWPRRVCYLREFAEPVWMPFAKCFVECAQMDRDELEWLAHWCVTDGNINETEFIEAEARDLTPDGFDIFIDAVMVEYESLLEYGIS